MRLRAATIALIGLASCGGDETPSSEPTCCIGAQGKTLRTGACQAEETAGARSDCEGAQPSTCGDGLYQPALETCDASSPLAPSCAEGAACVACACGAPSTCGDGVRTAPEQCEESAECADPMAVCRGCACVYRDVPVSFEDASGDATVALARDLTRVTMTLGGPPVDVLEVLWANDPTPRPGRAEVCLVIVDAASAPLDRLCVASDGGGPPRVALEQGGNTRTLSAGANYLAFDPTSPGVGLRLNTSVGLHYERANGFHWESAYDGAAGDRLPGSGELAFTEILGR